MKAVKWALVAIGILAILVVGGCSLILGTALVMSGGGGQDIQSSGSGGGGFTPDEQCSMNQACDLGPGQVTVTRATATDFIDIGFDKPLRSNGELVAVDYTYTSDRSQPISQPMDEPQWVLVDGKGHTYTVNFDASSTLGIDRDKQLGGGTFDDIQPGSPVDGVVVFDVPTKGATDFKLRLTDPLEPSVGKTAEMPLPATQGQY